MRYYKNQITGEIINFKSVYNEFKGTANYEELIKQYLKDYTEYSDNHPIIHELPKISFNFPFSAGTREFINVPLSIAIQYADNRELWENCPALYNFGMLDCINEIENSGEYAYNSTVGKLFCSKYNLGEFKDGESFISALVYCCQKVKHLIKAEKSEKALFEKMTEEGYIKATDEILNSAIGTEKRFLVVLNGTNMLGNEVKSVSEKKYKLTNWGEQGLHWMDPRAKRKGYKAFKGQYIKAL